MLTLVPCEVLHPGYVPAGCRSWRRGPRACMCAGPVPWAGRRRTGPPSLSRVGASPEYQGTRPPPHLSPTTKGALGHPCAPTEGHPSTFHFLIHTGTLIPPMPMVTRNFSSSLQAPQIPSTLLHACGHPDTICLCPHPQTDTPHP